MHSKIYKNVVLQNKSGKDILGEYEVLQNMDKRILNYKCKNKVKCYGLCKDKFTKLFLNKDKNLILNNFKQYHDHIIKGIRNDFVLNEKLNSKINVINRKADNDEKVKLSFTKINQSKALDQFKGTSRVKK